MGRPDGKGRNKGSKKRESLHKVKINPLGRTCPKWKFSAVDLLTEHQTVRYMYICPRLLCLPNLGENAKAVRERMGAQASSCRSQVSVKGSFGSLKLIPRPTSMGARTGGAPYKVGVPQLAPLLAGQWRKGDVLESWPGCRAASKQTSAPGGA